MTHSLTYAGQPAEGFVYVMECSGFYKIGWSGRPTIRHSHIQTANPVTVTLVGVIEGSRMDEATWHEAFKDKRMHGEWFSLTEEDVARVLHENWGIDRIPDGDWGA